MQFCMTRATVDCLACAESLCIAAPFDLWCVSGVSVALAQKQSLNEFCFHWF
jgi:hypothetical protein